MADSAYMEGNYLLGDALLEKMKKSNSPSELEEQHHYIRLLELERQYFSGRLTESDLPSADTLLQYYDNSAFIDKNAISLLLEGYINISIQNYPTAIDFYLKAKKKAEDAGDKRLLCLINREIGDVYYQQGMLEDCVPYYRAYYQLAVCNNDLRRMAYGARVVE